MGGSGEPGLLGLDRKGEEGIRLPGHRCAAVLVCAQGQELESQELTALEQIKGRTAAGTAALAAVRVDIAEIGSAIKAWDTGKPAQFITILKRYLNDGRPKSAFALAGAGQCG